MKQEIWRQYPVGDKVALVERLLDRGVLAPTDGAPNGDNSRAIAKNRQPGKCCDTGCTAPGQAIMVDLPVSRKAD
jgi:4-hydroxybutyryl-CoA dehydratase/vinylacetyl-CoA-Delta-isomerase